ncbi:hypothetical protein ACFWUP_02870 [Nocardia sp. NPDC058658]|uniref:hypothetical protein n=1 Tax=Nocardia sp. NPDC058658 TaxID=3346580 RepID=UPI00364717D4
MLLDSLTAVQRELLAAVRDEWIAVGLSTEPADREAAEQGAIAAYLAGGPGAADGDRVAGIAAGRGRSARTRRSAWPVSATGSGTRRVRERGRKSAP